MAVGILLMGGCRTFHSLNDEDSLYHFITLQHLDEMIKNKQVFCRLVIKWEDSWELSSRFIDKAGEPNGSHDYQLLVQNVEHVQNNLYGLCFSQVTDTDALWRIYSHDKLSVCIKTSC